MLAVQSQRVDLLRKSGTEFKVVDRGNEIEA